MQRIVIVVGDEVGVIADISRLLADDGINIETLDAESHGDHGMIILTTDQPDEALHVLRRASYRAIADDALILKLRDEPGALAKVSERLKRANVNIRSVHILNRRDRYSTVAMAVDDRDKARELLGNVIIM